MLSMTVKLSGLDSQLRMHVTGIYPRRKILQPSFYHKLKTDRSLSRSVQTSRRIDVMEFEKGQNLMIGYKYYNVAKNKRTGRGSQYMTSAPCLFVGAVFVNVTQ